MFQGLKNKKDLVDIIYTKFGGELQKEKISKIIDIIICWIRKQLYQNKHVMIDGFGSFVFYRYIRPKFYDIFSEKIQPEKLKTTVKFDANSKLKQLLKNKKEHFNGK